MYRTLSELRDSIDKMIEMEGENAPCAAFVFSCHDVFEFNEETDQEDYFPMSFTESVLSMVGGSDYIYEQIGELIDDSIRMQKRMRNSVTP